MKRVPGLWNTFYTAVKKTYSWFQSHGWSVVKNIAKAISIFLDAWNIWNGFH